MTISRRHVLQMTGAALAAPAVLRATDALASSGTVKVLAWQDYIQPNIAEKFQADTGITLDLTTFGSNDEAISITKADLRAAVDALDNFLESNAAAVNNAIPQPARGALSARQKAWILARVIERRFKVGA